MPKCICPNNARRIYSGLRGGHIKYRLSTLTCAYWQLNLVQPLAVEFAEKTTERSIRVLLDSYSGEPIIMWDVMLGQLKHAAGFPAEAIAER